MELFNLDGQVAMVTGSGSGIGQAIAIGLAEAGADVGCFGHLSTGGWPFCKADATVPASRASNRPFKKPDAASA